MNEYNLNNKLRYLWLLRERERERERDPHQQKWHIISNSIAGYVLQLYSCFNNTRQHFAKVSVCHKPLSSSTHLVNISRFYLSGLRFRDGSLF